MKPKRKPKKRMLRDAKSLAKKIQESNKITLSDSHVSGNIDDATALKNIKDTAAGNKAKRSSYDGAPGGEVALDESMLQGMLDLADDYDFRVSEIAGGSHSPNSRHYAGVAFDVDTINGAAVNANNPDYKDFMEKGKDLGAKEVLGPGDAGHSTHVHLAWPRPQGIKQKDDPTPYCEASRYANSKLGTFRPAAHLVDRHDFVREFPLLDPTLSRTTQILQQIKLTQEITAGLEKKDAQFAAIEDWKSHLFALLTEHYVALRDANNVDPTAPEPDRVHVFWPLLGIVIDDLDEAAADDRKFDIKRFLLNVAWHEGGRLRYRKQLDDGPARSFFQFEAHRAKDAGLYARQKRWIGKLAAASDQKEQGINDGVDALPQFGEPKAPWFPANNLIETCLLTTDLFGVYLARIAFKKVAAAIPTTDDDQAAYWFKYWKGAGDEDALKKIFIAACKHVRPYIPR